MKAKTLPIAEIKPNPDNPRVIKDAQFKKLVASLKAAPWMLSIRPLVINAQGVVLGGNMRLKAAQHAGYAELPVICVDELTADQQREFIIKDNLGYGEWDMGALASWDAVELADWGLDASMLRDMQEDLGDDSEGKADAGSIESIETDIQLGDIITIGNHRLICGDATCADTVASLIAGGEPPALMITDPPYGVDYSPEWREKLLGKSGRSVGKVKNDGVADWTTAWASSPSRVAYIYHDGLKSDVVFKSVCDAGYDVRNQIVWVKPSIVMGRGAYHFKHEPLLYAVRKGASADWIGGRKQSTVWEIGKEKDADVNPHSTQKPIECMARPMRNHAGDVYDPFLGSGTTMVAAHLLKRKCYGIELEPRYCQVTIDRMKRLDPSIKIEKICRAK